ncbi:MAG: adenylate/guanylate cyclase domain-containing protein [Ignavibacteriaceae bacterium]|nr:adenylate/guanylate cyclase domain-containing protein [Ignavibacteriaceae bacterium]
MTRVNLLKITFLVCDWVIAALFYVFFESTLRSYHNLSTNIMGIEYDLGRSLLVSVIVVIISGTAIASFEVLYFNKLLRKQPFGKTLIIKTSFYLLNIFMFTSIAILIIASTGLDKPLFHPAVFDAYTSYLGNRTSLLLMIYWGLAVMSGLFVLQISDKLGQGVLINFLLGKYHQPKEEMRIFMFLDLKASTPFAEEHGHVKYSRLIQDCFYDLTDIVIKRNALVYQYVGDEVVLTWDVEKGVKDNNCIATFFDFDRALKKRDEYYLKNYGRSPEFKAGIHYGEAVITELGGVKKEIAYHGDTLNTASRIQSVCNEMKKCLLVSADLLGILYDPKLDEKYIIESKGVVQLKGKRHHVGLFSIEEKDMSVALS